MNLYERFIESQCNKQTTVAIIMKDKQLISIGTNFVMNRQSECPRKDSPSGMGYELCKDICFQPAHAEFSACYIAGPEKAKDATLYLIGHTYCCEKCLNVMKNYGIREVVIVDTNEIINLNK